MGDVSFITSGILRTSAAVVKSHSLRIQPPLCAAAACRVRRGETLPYERGKGPERGEAAVNSQGYESHSSYFSFDSLLSAH